MKDLIIICGPTASGKTKLSIAVAKAFDGEVISADSMQIYRELDVGTAKVTTEEMDGVMHHLIDVVNPDQSFSVAEYVDAARKAIDDVVSRGKTPILVGGTGLYVNSLVLGYNFSQTSKNEALRAELSAYLEENGKDALFARLKDLAPERAEKLHPNDTKRVIRALETAMDGQIAPTGGGVDADKVIPCYKAVMIEPPREELYARINARVDEMFNNGLEAEVRGAIEKYNLTPDHQSMQAIGYKEWFDYLDNKATIQDTAERIKKATRNYAKRQLTWFRKFPQIHIYNELNVEKIIEELQKS